MSPTLTCLVLALVGVDLGYRPAANGGADFIIQINPATLQALRPGQSIEIDVPREAREVRPSHFSIWLGNESLPHVLPVAASSPPAMAPIVPASPVMPATAAMPAPSRDVPAGREPARSGPPFALAAPRSTTAHGWPLLTPRTSAQSAATGSPLESRIGGLAPVNTDVGTLAPDRPWLAMCLLVIALLASNVYVGWLFWDARQRYRGLLTRTFSFGPRTAEA